MQAILSLNRSFVAWFTGLPSSGKTTLAVELQRRLLCSGIKSEHLDGDEVRQLLPAGFDHDARERHLRAVGFAASLLEKHGVPVLASFVSPYRSSRFFNRQLCKNFIEIFVATSKEECARRDVKGLYQKAEAGEVAEFTGVSSPYEKPDMPELTLITDSMTVEESVSEIYDYLIEHGYLAEQDKDE